MEHAIGTRSATRPRVGDWIVNVLVLLVTVAIAWAGAAPDFVYWFTFLWSFFK